MMKTVSIIVILACMVFTGNAGAQIAKVFDGVGTDPNLWEDGSNWVIVQDVGEGGWTTRGVLPDEFEQAMIRNDAHAKLNTSQTVNMLGVGRWSQNGIVTVNTGGDLHVKYQNLGTGMAWNDGFGILAENPGTWGILNVNGGTVAIDRLLMFGNTAGATGTLNMYSGTVQVGYGHPGTANQGGLIFQGSAYINIYGGTLDTTFMQQWGTPPVIAIRFYSTDGKIIVDNHFLGGSGAYIDNLITSGKITAEPGLKIVTQVVDNSGDLDFEIFAEVDCPNWPEFPAADINRDCVVDIDDLMILTAHWLEDGTL